MTTKLHGDTSINDAVHTFFHYEKWRLEKRNLEAKVGTCAIENFCDALLDSNENWNSMESYNESLPKTKKFDLDERSGVDV